MQFSHVRDDDQANITVFIDGLPLVAHSDHPNFQRIVDEVTAPVVSLSDEEIADLFDVSKAAERRFARLSERVTVANGIVFFDGDEIDTSLTQQIVRFLDADVEDWRPLVAFFEKVQSNPNAHSRLQLYDWLSSHNLTLTSTGDIIGYKGVRLADGDSEAEFRSGFRGHAIVDGQEFRNSYIPNDPGSTVEMPRAEVQHDPSAACSVGLHVGTFDYAKGYGPTVLEVEVNPRDVVSVPTDAEGAKVRVCRYVIRDVIEQAYDTPIAPDPDPEPVEAESPFVVFTVPPIGTDIFDLLFGPPANVTINNVFDSADDGQPARSVYERVE